MAPARWAQQVIDAMAYRAALPGLFEHLAPFLKSYPNRIVRLNIFREAINRPFFLWLKSAKQPVPDDQYPPVVLIEVFQVAAMVHPVVRGGIKNKFNRPGQQVNGFSMYPELVNKADLLHQHHHNGMKTHQGHPHPENKGAGEVARPGLAQGGTQVVMLRAMVYYMRSPEPAHIVRHIMKTVIREVVSEEGQ